MRIISVLCVIVAAVIGFCTGQGFGRGRYDYDEGRDYRGGRRGSYQGNRRGSYGGGRREGYGMDYGERRRGYEGLIPSGYVAF